MLMIIGAGLRGWELRERGLWYPDEALYLGNAQALHVLLDTWRWSPEAPDLTWRAAVDAQLPFPVTFEDAGVTWNLFTTRGKILYVWLLTLCTPAHGPAPLVAPLVLNVVLGVLVIPATWFMVRAWTRDSLAGIVAAATVTASGLYIHYSRSALPSGLNLLVWTGALAVWGHAWPREGTAALRSRALLGGLMALSVTCHYATLSLLPFVGIADAAGRVWMHRKVTRSVLGGLLAYGAGGFAVLLGVQTASVIIARGAGALGYPNAFSYVGDVVNQFTFFFTHYAQYRPWSYRLTFAPYLVALMESPPVAVVLCGSALACVVSVLRRPRGRHVGILLAAGLFYGVFVQDQATKLARAIAPAWPLLILSFGAVVHYGGVRLRRYGLNRRKYGLACAALAAGVLALGIPNTYPFHAAHAPSTALRDLAREAAPGTRVVTPSSGMAIMLSIVMQRPVQAVGSEEALHPGDWLILTEHTDRSAWPSATPRIQLTHAEARTSMYLVPGIEVGAPMLPPWITWRAWPTRRSAAAPATVDVFVIPESHTPRRRGIHK